MPTLIYDRNDLIAMLRWQFEIGIDEALLDFPDALASPVKLSDLLATINTKVGLPAKTPASPTVDFTLEKATKLVASQNGRKEVVPTVAPHPSSRNITDLSEITSLADLNKSRPNSFFMRVFFDAKSDEIQDVFRDGPKISISETVSVLNRIAPMHSSKWRTINF